MTISTDIYQACTDKTIPEFIKDLGRSMTMSGFIIHNEDRMEMARHFGFHGVEVAEDFDLHMVQVCAPKRSAQALKGSHERAVLMPRFIVVFGRDGETQVRLLRLGEELVRSLIDDEEFVQLNVAVCNDLRAAIEEAL